MQKKENKNKKYARQEKLTMSKCETCTIKKTLNLKKTPCQLTITTTLNLRNVKCVKMPDYENRNQAVASLGEYLSTKPGGIVCFPQRSDPKKMKRASFIQT